MDNNIRKTKENIFRKHYEELVAEAEKESRRREDERRHELLSENPLDSNYARWATDEEFKSTLTPIILEQDGYPESGIPLVCENGITYVDSSDSHSLIIGSSGSKKSRLFMMPGIFTLSRAGESMVITDPKGELFERTSGYLKDNGYKVYCVNFRDDNRQNSWNPLEIPRRFFSMGKFDLAVGLLNDFAHISVPHSRRNSDPFWDNSARSAFMGMLLILLMLAENTDEVNIRSLLRLRRSLFNGRALSNHRENSLFSRIMDLIDEDCLAGFYLSTLAIAPDRTFGSIMATLDNHLMKFLIRPEITDMLCHNDINFSELGNEKTAIYLVMPDEKETYHRLISIFIQQCYETLIFEAQKQEGKRLRNRVNFLLDEFSSLPKIKEFPSMIAAARSRNIRFNIVVQSEKQLFSHYDSDAETIEGNCNNWIFLYSKELNTLEKISQLCGTQKSGKPLITLSRLQRLNKDAGEALVFHGREFPYLSHLDDINNYGITEAFPATNETPCSMPTRVFHLERVLACHPDEFLRAKLSSEYFDRKHKKYPLHFSSTWNFLEAIKYTDRNIFQSPFYSAAKNCAGDNITILAGSNRNFSVFVNKQGEKSIIKEQIPINAIFTIPDFITQNILIVSEEETDILHALADKVLITGSFIPIHFDGKHLSSAWNKKFFKKKDVPLLLTVMLANELMKADSPESHLLENGTISGALWEYARKLNAEFHKDPKGKPEFLILLSNLDKAENVADAIWQAWEIGSYSNVQLIVTVSDDRIADANCLEYRPSDKNCSYASPMVFCFNADTKTVSASQKEAPPIIIYLE